MFKLIKCEINVGDIDYNCNYCPYMLYYSKQKGHCMPQKYKYFRDYRKHKGYYAKDKRENRSTTIVIHIIL